MKKITFQYGDNINFYGVDLTHDMWKNVSAKSLEFVSSLYIMKGSDVEKPRKTPLKAVFLNHLGSKEYYFQGKIADIGTGAPLYISNYLVCEIDDKNSLWRNILKHGGYESEKGCIETELLLELLYNGRYRKENHTTRDIVEEDKKRYREESYWLIKEEHDELKRHVVFSSHNEKNNTVDIMILMHFFLDREFYVILPYGGYDGSVICTEEGILEYISNGNLDASIVYKRSEVLDKENNPIIVNEDMQGFINGVEQQVVKLDKKKVSDNQVLNQFFKIIDRESRKNNGTIQIEAEISSSGKILGRLKSKSNNPSNYKKLEDELQGYGKISKNVHGGITTGLEVEKSIKIEPQDE